MYLLLDKSFMDLLEECAEFQGELNGFSMSQVLNT